MHEQRTGLWKFATIRAAFSLDLVGNGLGHHGNGRKEDLVGCQATRVEHIPLRRFLLFRLLNRFFGRLRCRWLRLLVGFVFEWRNKHFGLQMSTETELRLDTSASQRTQRESWCDLHGTFTHRLHVFFRPRFVPRRFGVTKMMRCLLLSHAKVAPVHLVDGQMFNFPIVVPQLLGPAQSLRMLLGGGIHIVPPNVEFLGNRTQAQEHGRLLFFVGAVLEGLAVIRDLGIGVPRFFRVAHHRGLLVGLFRHGIPPSIGVVFLGHGRLRLGFYCCRYKWIL
jgi:hypothetical protein